MLYRKQGFPDEGELVLCTVTKVQPHSVFVNLDEYDKGGMIHISEISPGRIRNIRDYVVEGKKIVCKILRINKEKGYIDLSLRRVNENQRRKKVEEIKQEQKSEKIIEHVAKELKLDLKKLYSEVSEKVLPQFGSLFTGFYEVVESDLVLADLGINDAAAAKLEEVIRQRIKPLRVEIRGTFDLQSYAPNGIEIIKKAVLAATKDAESLDIKYMGAGKYALLVVADNFPDAEKIVEKATTIIEKNMQGEKYSFTKQEGKKIN